MQVRQGTHREGLWAEPGTCMWEVKCLKRQKERGGKADPKTSMEENTSNNVVVIQDNSNKSKISNNNKGNTSNCSNDNRTYTTITMCQALL